MHSIACPNCNFSTSELYQAPLKTFQWFRIICPVLFCTMYNFIVCPCPTYTFFCTVTYRYLCDNHLCCICVVCDVNCSDHPKLQIENSGKLSFFPLQKEVIQWTLELGTSTAASAGMIDLECSLCQLVVHECMHMIITSMNDNTHWKLSNINEMVIAKIKPVSFRWGNLSI